MPPYICIDGSIFFLFSNMLELYNNDYYYYYSYYYYYIIEDTLHDN